MLAIPSRTGEESQFVVFVLCSVGPDQMLLVVTSLIAVKWFVAYIGRHGMALFAWYRIILACAILLYFN